MNWNCHLNINAIQLSARCESIRWRRATTIAWTNESRLSMVEIQHEGNIKELHDSCPLRRGWRKICYGNFKKRTPYWTHFWSQDKMYCNILENIKIMIFFWLTDMIDKERTEWLIEKMLVQVKYERAYLLGRINE